MTAPRESHVIPRVSAPRPYGPISLSLRVSLAFGLFAVTGFSLVPLLLLLLPWRPTCISLVVRYANLVALPILALLGIRIEGASRARLAAEAPAIFVINHTSALDTLLSLALLPPGTVGVVKREGLALPVFGQVYWLGGHLLIDRSNRERAHASMDQLARDVKRWGLSPWLGPEGTRSSDGRLGPFKKGFAHLALATGLPVVPLVLHDAHALWPLRTFQIAPGTVRIDVLPTIQTTGWRPETLTENVESVRQAMAEALAPHQRPA